MDALKSKGQMLDQINLEQIPRSGFDLSYSTKGTGKIGRIIPTRCMECLPSDSIKGSSQAALQFQPLAVPILANMRVKQETWYVPNHILLDNWDTFITKGQDLSDNSVLPSFNMASVCRILFKRLFGESSDVMYAGAFTLTSPLNGSNGFFGILMSVGFIEDLIALLRGTSSEGLKFVNYCKKFQVDDLFDYRFELADQLEAWFNSSCTRVKFKKTNGDIVEAFPVTAYYLHSSASGSTKSNYPIYFSDYNDSSLSEYNLTSRFSDNDKKLIGYVVDYMGQNTGIMSDDMRFVVGIMYDYLSSVIGVGSLFDYLGYKILTPLDFDALIYRLFEEIDTGSAAYTESLFSLMRVLGDLSSTQQNFLPLRACYAIWYNNYRDKLLETAAPEPSTASTITDDELFICSLLRIRAWSKDSFNTALANTGTGNMVVPISQNLNGIRKILAVSDDEAKQLDLNLNSFTLGDGTQIDLPTRYLSGNHGVTTQSGSLKYEFSLDTLRRAGRTEKWIQKALIYGNLIQDALFTHWGVKIKNERIQLPEFVTSSVELVKIDTILNNTTISSVDDSVQATAGDKAGFASAYDDGTSFDWYSPENGYLISFMTVLPEQTYAYGAPRHLSKLRIFDFAFPEFAQIGMDAVYNEEVRQSSMYVADSYSKGIFGYQGRYYDYKCKQDEEHGQLRTTEDMYTFSRDYNVYDESSRPKLNYRFVHCHPSLDMFVVDDPSQDQFRYDIHHSVAASRALPVCGMSV